MRVQPGTYNASFYVLPNEPRYKQNMTHIDVSLRSDTTGTVFATSSILVNPNVTSHDYRQHASPTHNIQQAPNGNNSFFLIMNATEVDWQTFFFDLISLFGETYKGRANGLRKYFAKDLADLKPKLLCFPGGNNLKDFSQFRRWK